MLCSACQHGLHIYHPAATETEDCACDFCTLVPEEVKQYLKERGMSFEEPDLSLAVKTGGIMTPLSTKEKMMNKFITYIKENKVPLIRNTLIVIATGGAIALVAYVAKSNGEEAEEAAALASE